MMILLLRILILKKCIMERCFLGLKKRLFLKVMRVEMENYIQKFFHIQNYYKELKREIKFL